MKKRVVAVCVCLVTLTMVSGMWVRVEETTPISPGESLLPQGGKEVWQVEGMGETEATLSYPGWMSMRLHVPDRKERSRATLSRQFDDLPVDGFDQFVCNIAPYNTQHTIFVTLTITTDQGVITLEERTISPSTKANADVVVDLDGAQAIKSISVECTTDESTLLLVIHQMLLRNRSEFAAWQNYWQRFDDIRWEGLIKDESYEPAYELLHGMMFDQNALDAWREHYLDDISQGSFPEAPEKAITQFTRSWNIRGYEAQRILDSGTTLNNRTASVALQAILFRDKELMRLAARYLLSLCTVENWNRYPDIVGSGTYTAFGSGSKGFEAALALDCVGEMLTPKGHDYVLKMLAQKAFMPVTYSGWSRSFMWVSNQGPAFLRGKLSALLMMEQRWRRAIPYTDLAKAELDEVATFMFRPDGSFMEASASYLSYTIYCLMPVYQNFAMMRGKELSAVVPPNIGKSGAFAQIFASSSKHPGRAITTIGESTTARNLPAQHLAYMALACPDSMWVNLFNKTDEATIESLKRNSGMGVGIVFSRQFEDLRGRKDVTPANLVVLEEVGLASSWRDTTKIVFIGDAKAVGKKHPDVGSFVLEYAGDIYAVDMLGKDGSIYSRSQYHTMLVAIDERADLCDALRSTQIGYHSPKRDAMRPNAHGDAHQFHAVIDATPSWAPEHFTRWVRTVDSPNPEQFTITDSYTLGEKASGAAFVWMTYLPWTLDGKRITLAGEYGSTCEIIAPEDGEITIEEFIPDERTLKGMALPPDHPCARIIIRKAGAAGGAYEMQVQVTLRP